MLQHIEHNYKYAKIVTHGLNFDQCMCWSQLCSTFEHGAVDGFLYANVKGENYFSSTPKVLSTYMSCTEL